MSKYSIDGQTLTDIADAIRSKTGDTAALTAAAMAEAIAGISGGGGGFELLAHHETEITDSSTTVKSIGPFNCGAEASDGSVIVYVKIRRKEGKQASICHAADSFLINRNAAAGASASQGFGMNFSTRLNANSVLVSLAVSNTIANSEGIWCENMSSSGRLYLKHRSSTYTVQGTYLIDVYKIPFPDNDSPYN